MKKYIETSSGLMAKLVDKSNYDGHWVSSLCHSTQLGLPDNELVSLRERVDLVSQIKRVSSKPIIVDVDTFGSIEHISFYADWFAKAGAYAVIMEDKRYPKQNSLLGENNHQLEDVDTFCEKIKEAKKGAGEMQVFARLESLIAEKSMSDALIRAEAYVRAGADGIMIHSKQKVDSWEVMTFAKDFREKWKGVPLIAVPTTYNLPPEHPFDIVIDANQLTRVSITAMRDYIEGKGKEMASVQDIFDLLGH